MRRRCRVGPSAELLALALVLTAAVSSPAAVVEDNIEAISLPQARTSDPDVPQAGQAAPLPALHEFVLQGATVYSTGECQRMLSLEVGRPLRQRPDELAVALQRRYEDEGYSFARVSAEFVEATGTLTLRVDEGVIDEIEFEGVGEATARRFARDFTVRPGDPFNRAEIQRGVDRLLAQTGGGIRLSSEAPKGAMSPDSRLLPEQQWSGFGLVDRDGRRALVIRLDKRSSKFSLSVGTAGREDWFSPVDGLNLALGFNETVFDHTRFNHTFITGYLSYKTAAERPSYSLGVERPFLGAPKIYLNAAIQDLTDSDDWWRLSTIEQSLVALGVKRSYRDYYRSRGYHLGVAARVLPRHEFAVSWRDERQNGVANTTDFSIFRDEGQFPPNPLAEDGRLHALLVRYTFDTRGFSAEQCSETYLRHQADDLYGSEGRSWIRDEPESGLRLEWTSELTSPGTLGGDFDFRRHIVNLRSYGRPAPRQYLDFRVLVGLAGGNLPEQRMFAVGGIGSVRGYPFKQATGERMVLGNLEYKVRLVSHLAGLGFLDSGGVYRRADAAWSGWLNGAGVGVEVARTIRVEVGWPLNGPSHSPAALVRLSSTF